MRSMESTRQSTDPKGLSRMATTSDNLSMTDRPTQSASVTTSMSTQKCTILTERFAYTAEALDTTPPTILVISSKEKLLNEEKYASTCTQRVIDATTALFKPGKNIPSTTSSNLSTHSPRRPITKLSIRSTTPQTTPP